MKIRLPFGFELTISRWVPQPALILYRGPIPPSMVNASTRRLMAIKAASK